MSVLLSGNSKFKCEKISSYSALSCGDVGYFEMLLIMMLFNIPGTICKV